MSLVEDGINNSSLNALNVGRWVVGHQHETRAREILSTFNLLAEKWKIPPGEIVRILNR